MLAERIWPNGLRYLWTDAFGVVPSIEKASAQHSAPKNACADNWRACEL